MSFEEGRKARQEAQEKRNSRLKHVAKWTGAALGALAIVAAIVFLVVTNWGSNALNQSVTGKAPTTTTTKTSTPVTTPVKRAADTTCTFGEPLVYSIRTSVDDVVRPEDGAQYKFEDKPGLLKAAAEDPQVLAAYAHEFLPVSYPNGRDWKGLINPSGTCLNNKGAEALEKLELFVENLPMHIGEADAGWINTGVGKDGIVSNTVPGISGDRKSMIFTLPDGKEVVILLRCGNPAHKAAIYPREYVPPPSGGGNPPPPPITTVVPPPPPPPCDDCNPPPPPPCTTCECLGNCPPPPPPPCEVTGECKSPNPVDYPHITDAPKAEVTKPPAPPSVPQTPAGTTRPGTPAPPDVTAPEATPVPTHINTQAPPIPQAPEPEAPADTDVDPDA